jgi:hypothetical protein
MCSFVTNQFSDGKAQEMHMKEQTVSHSLTLLQKLAIRSQQVKAQPSHSGEVEKTTLPDIYAWCCNSSAEVIE